MGEQTQFDLRVVGADQNVARLGDEGVADAAAFLGQDRDVLQVRIVRRQPPGGGDRLREAGMHAAGVGIDLLDQRVGIGGFQLLQLPASRGSSPAVPTPGPPATATAEIMPQAPVFIRLPPGRPIQFDGAASPQLLGPDVEFETREAMALLFHHRHALLEIDRHAAQVVGVHLDARARSMCISTPVRRRSTCSYSARDLLKRSRGSSACQRRKATSASSAA